VVRRVSDLGGYTGKILRVHLGKEEVSEEPLKSDLCEKFMGGRGLAAKFLLDEITVKTDPFSLRNKIFVMTGCLSGTEIPSAVKFTIATISPLTNIYGFTMASGFFAQKLKAAGYDGIIIEGKSDSAKYLWVHDGSAEIREAGHLWGLPTDVSQMLIMDEVAAPAETAVIGPAGENLVRYASVAVGKRFCGRCGVGAIFGHKNLKGIAVFGSRKVEFHSPELAREAAREMIKALRETSPTADLYPTYGTTYFMGSMNKLGVLPVNNFRDSGVYNKISGVDEKEFRKFVIKDSTCFRCPVACEKITAVKEGNYALSCISGPQYETLWALGPQCGNDRMDLIIAGNMLCNRLGLDTISTGNAIGFLMECFERGYIDIEMEPKFGRYDIVLPLIHAIAYKRGIGKYLADGVMRFAEKIEEAKSFAMHVKGLELPAYDVRATPGMALAYATSSRGGCHLRAWVIGPELSEAYKPYSIEGRAALVRDEQNRRAFYDSVGMCLFAMKTIPFSLLAKAVSAVTGTELNEENAMTIGERVYNLERVILARQGIRRDDDNLPERFYTEPMPTGPHTGQRLVKKEFEKLKDEYYELRGWNEEGVPTQETLRNLSIL
jgi:aldehyde:ferredoxin oxidoreductase